MSEVLVYLETRELLCHVVFIGAKILLPGNSIFAQLRFKESVDAFIGERFIVRKQSPSVTIGGGVVLDPQATKLKTSQFVNRDTFLQKRLSLELDDLIISEISKYGLVKVNLLLSSSQYSSQEIASRVDYMAIQNRLVLAAGYAIHFDLWHDNQQRILNEITTRYKANPLQAGTPQIVIQAMLAWPHDVCDVLIQQLASKGKLARQDDILHLPDNRPSLSIKQKLLEDKILKLFGAQPVAPPTLHEIGKMLADSLPVVYYLIKQGVLIDLGEGILF
jgi:selenocysteine-specific elongation factor